MSVALLAVGIAFGWAAATGDFSLPNLLFGGLVGGVGLFLIRDRVQTPRLLLRTRRLALLGGHFAYELLLSAVRVAWLVVQPDLGKHLKPGIIAFPLTITSDAQITLLANLITLTPGTLSVDVSDDRKFLYVHAIRITDREALIREIADGFEAAITRAFR
jgi:multicomponent Na+:H+ antiporter subunit E